MAVNAPPGSVFFPAVEGRESGGCLTPVSPPPVGGGGFREKGEKSWTRRNERRLRLKIVAAASRSDPFRGFSSSLAGEILHGEAAVGGGGRNTQQRGMRVSDSLLGLTSDCFTAEENNGGVTVSDGGASGLSEE